MTAACTIYSPFVPAREDQFSVRDAVYPGIHPAFHAIYEKQYAISGFRDFLTSAPNFII